MGVGRGGVQTDFFFQIFFIFLRAQQSNIQNNRKVINNSTDVSLKNKFILGYKNYLVLFLLKHFTFLDFFFLDLLFFLLFPLRYIHSGSSFINSLNNNEIHLYSLTVHYFPGEFVYIELDWIEE